MLFDGAAASLVKLLAVPSRPSQPTHFQAKRPVHGSGVRKDQLNKRKLANIRSAHFARLPTEIHDMIFRQVRRAHTHVKWTRNPLSYKKYAGEDKGMIDVLHLSLTSTRLWAIGRIHIEDFYRGQLGRWAGTKIVALSACAGACQTGACQTGGNPPGLFSKE
jgi:hypothetical protein